MTNSIQLRRILFYILSTCFIITLLLIIGKAGYPYIIGPRIISYDYKEKDGLYTITGTSTRVKILYIQGKETSIDTNGSFNTQIVKQEPYTTLIIDARDRFDHSLIIKKEI